MLKNKLIIGFIFLQLIFFLNCMNQNQEQAEDQVNKKSNIQTLLSNYIPVDDVRKIIVNYLDIDWNFIKNGKIVENKFLIEKGYDYYFDSLRDNQLAVALFPNKNLIVFRKEHYSKCFVKDLKKNIIYALPITNIMAYGNNQIACAVEKQLKFWNLEKLAYELSLATDINKYIDDDVTGIVYSRGNNFGYSKFLAIGLNNGIIIIVDLISMTSKQIDIKDNGTEDIYIHSLDFSPNDKYLVCFAREQEKSSDEQEPIKIFDITKNASIQKLPYSNSGCRKLFFSDDNSMVCLISTNRITIFKWASKEEYVINERPNVDCLLINNRLIVFCEGEIVNYIIDKKKKINNCDQINSYNLILNNVNNGLFTNNGELLAIAGLDGNFYIYQSSLFMDLDKAVNFQHSNAIVNKMRDFLSKSSCVVS